LPPPFLDYGPGGVPSVFRLADQFAENGAFAADRRPARQDAEVDSSVIAVGPALGVVLVLLTASAVATSVVGRLHLGQALASAAVRAIIQLSLVSPVIAG